MSHNTETEVTDGQEVIDSATDLIERMLRGLTDLAEAFKAKGKENCANRFMVASGFLCLAVWTMTGMPGKMVSLKVLELAPMLGDIDCNNCPDKSDEDEATSQASPDGSGHLPN